MLVKQHPRVRPGTRLEVVFDGFSVDGEGIGRVPALGRAVFVPFTLPGERWLVELVALGHRKLAARPVQLLEASAERISAPCPVFGRCGGCQLQHVVYPAQLRLKEQVLRDALRSLAGLTDPPAFALFPAPAPFGYRNRGQYPVALQGKRVVTGFFAAYSHEVVASQACPLHDPRIDQAVGAVRAWARRQRVEIYREQEHQGWLRHVVTRVARNVPGTLVCLVGTRERMQDMDDLVARLQTSVPDLVGVVQNINPQRTNVILGDRTVPVWGQTSLEESFLGVRFRLSAEAFSQVNTEQAERLFSRVHDFLEEDPDPSRPLLDAYCGVGVLALTWAARGRTALGIEVSATALADARWALQANGLSGVELHHGTVEQILPGLVRAGLRPGAAVVDPPRKGLAPEVIGTLDQAQVERIAYVSCHPGSLARDLKQFFARGYRLTRLEAFDMFPQTCHVEVLAGLVRGG